MKSALSQLFSLAGMVALGVGLWWIYPPICLVVMGALLLTAGIVGAMR